MTKNTKSTTNNDKESKLAHLVGPTDPQIDAQARDRLNHCPYRTLTQTFILWQSCYSFDSY